MLLPEGCWGRQLENLRMFLENGAGRNHLDTQLAQILLKLQGMISYSVSRFSVLCERLEKDMSNFDRIGDNSSAKL